VPVSLEAQVDLNLGLAAYYPFSNNANDVSGNNNNPVFNNATLTADRFGNPNSAYHFNGVSNYMKIPNAPSLNSTNKLSVCAWVKVMGFYTGTCHGNSIMMKGDADYLPGNYLLRFDDGAFTNFQNCATPGIDPAHQNFYGAGVYTPPPGYAPYIQTNQWHNVIATYDGTTARLYIDCLLRASMPQAGLTFTNGYDLFLGTLNTASFPYWFNGDMDEVRIYNRALNQDEVNVLGGCNSACTIKNDFSYKRDPCTPLNVEFSTNATGYNTIKWDFGDGNNANAVTTTSNPYASPGNYLVTMITDYGSCADTVKKTIAVDVQNDNLLVITPDTILCLGTTKKLRTQPALNFCWTPTTFLDNPNLPEPTTSTTQNITYYFTAEVTGVNLITNGNFNAGNSGFTSEYSFATPNVTEAQYFVGPNPQVWNPLLSNCTDHTTGNGNMLLVNGSPTPNIKVWTQTINITPNTNYAFSTWIQALYPPNPAQLQFSINGKDVGSMITASIPTCTWAQFFTNWNSGNSTSATISIVNKNTLVQGNDFALDDISFAPVFMKRDSVKITTATAVITTNNDTPICEGASVQLNTSGGVSYSWTPVTGLSDPNIGTPLASPVVTTQYTVTGIGANGCSATDIVNINVSPKPTITISNDTAICQNTSAQLLAGGGASYSWTPGATLSSTSAPNPVASPITNTMYYVTVTDANSCNNLDSVKVDIVSPDQFSINGNQSSCLNTSAQLNAAGGDSYSWQPASSLDDPDIPGPLASPLSTTTYFVTITENKCHESSTLSTTVTILPLPNINANSSNDIDCSTAQSKLIASGGITYSWTPAASLSNPNSGTTIATPTITTEYFVTGIDVSGCSNKGSVIVNVKYTNKAGYFMPTGFTPNNDGKNDCFGIKEWGLITNLEFSIYNRWGARVFFTTNPDDCWNGKYKGVDQDTGVFVFMVKAKTICESSVFRKGTFVLIR
jgi:gliding motility-associated-like protein